MKKLVLILCSLTVILSILSCEKDKDGDVDEISYGSSFGMCVGYCYQDLKINNSGQLTFTKTKNQQPSDSKTCKNTIAKSEVAAIKALLNDEKISALPAVIGCPDCADGGAEWVGVKSNGKTYKITFEYGKAPADLAAAVTKLKALAVSFKDCN